MYTCVQCGNYEGCACVLFNYEIAIIHYLCLSILAISLVHTNAHRAYMNHFVCKVCHCSQIGIPAVH